MAENPNCTIYIGNLDERVSDRVLYDILIQAGRVLDLHIPRDKESNKPKGFAFAEYESREIADYAVRLFSGLVTLYNRTLKFAMSGQDRPSPNLAAAIMPSTSLSHRYSPYTLDGLDISPHPNRLSMSSRVSPYPKSHEQGREPNGYRSPYDGQHYNYARKVFGATLDSLSSSRLSRYNSSSPISFPS